MILQKKNLPVTLIHTTVTSFHTTVIVDISKAEVFSVKSLKINYTIIVKFISIHCIISLQINVKQ